MKDLGILYPAARKVTVGKNTALVRPAKLCNMEEVAGITGLYLEMAGGPDTSPAYAVFCAKHGRAVARILAQQTTLARWLVWTPLRIWSIRRLPTHEILVWLAEAIYENQKAFRVALSGKEESQPDGAKFNSD